MKAVWMSDSLLANENAVVGATTAALSCNPSLGATPVTQSFITWVTSNRTVALLVVTGTFRLNGGKNVGRDINVTPSSVQDEVTCDTSKPPAVVTVPTGIDKVALMICADVSPREVKGETSNCSKPVLVPPTLTAVWPPKLTPGALELMKVSATTESGM